MNEKITVSQELMKKILVFFWEELEDYTGADIAQYDDDQSVAQIYDMLCDEFPPERLEKYFPGEFEFEDELPDLPTTPTEPHGPIE